jgi:hypothetical protein
MGDVIDAIVSVVDTCFVLSLMESESDGHSPLPLIYYRPGSCAPTQSLDPGWINMAAEKDDKADREEILLDVDDKEVSLDLDDKKAKAAAAAAAMAGPGGANKKTKMVMVSKSIVDDLLANPP